MQFEIPIIQAEKIRQRISKLRSRVKWAALAWLIVSIAIIVAVNNFKQVEWLQKKNTLVTILIIATLALLVIPVRGFIAANLINDRVVEQIRFDKISNILFIKTISNSSLRFPVDEIAGEIILRQPFAVLFFIEDSKYFNRLFRGDMFYSVKFGTSNLFIILSLFKEEPDLIKSLFKELAQSGNIKM